MATSLSSSFGYLKALFWPIHRHEKKMFVPILALMFLSCFNYSVLRVLKDTILITSAGAKVLPYIKLWGVLPGAILLTFIFSKLSKRFSFEKIFYFLTGGLLAFYALFIWVLYPFNNLVHPHAFAEICYQHLPQGFGGLISLFHYWSFTLFYILAELWSTMIMGVLCWGFINQVTKLEQSKRFYGLLGMASNLAALSAGLSTNFLTSFSSSWDISLQVLLALIILSGIVMMGVFKYLNVILAKEDPERIGAIRVPAKKKKKMKLKESLSYLLESRYLLYIAVLVIAYNLSISIMEVVWKDIATKVYPDPASFNRFMSNITTCIGFISLVMSICIPRWIERFKWTKIALVTPVFMLITGVGFFSFLLFNKVSSHLILGFAPLSIAAFFGSVQYIVSKAAKYSVFDTTKEMAFIPIDPELRLKGKAAIDGVGSRLGKSGASFFFQSLLIGVGSIGACVPYVGVLFVGVSAVWLSSTMKLGQQFEKKSEEEVSSFEEAGPSTPTPTQP
jgi:AAA family ATP:ADP antiporter